MVMSGLPLRVVVWVVALFCLPLVGCQQEAAPAPADATVRTAAAPVDQSSVAGRLEVTVQVSSWAEVQQMVAEHRGKVVVVDVWSTWCEPCVREFPNLVQLHRQYPDEVVCISLNIDYIGVATEPPDSFRDKVLKFVRQQEASFQNVISSDPDEDVLKALDAFSVPVVQVYDRDGNLRETFTNDDDLYGDEGFTYQRHIIPLIETSLPTS
jgi:thiol-disulfide isomerase/thioredoxin